MGKIVARREYGTTYEMSYERRYLPVKLFFSRSQFEKIKLGRIPMEMGDKWFIFFEDDILYCHIWSGEAIYEIRFDRNTFNTTKIIVVNDRSTMPIISDDREIEHLISMIKYSLLDGQDFRMEKLN